MIAETFLACGDAAGGFLKARYRSQSSPPNIIPLNVRLIRKQLSQQSWPAGNFDAMLDELVARWNALGRVAFFVDPDPNSQLVLMRLLSQLHSLNADHTDLRLMHLDEPWGEVSSGETAIGTFIADRVEAAHLEAASIVWAAYEAPTPEAWPEVSTCWGEGLFPFLSSAGKALLDDLPRSDSGLGSSERRVLSTIGKDGASVREVLRALHIQQANFLDACQIEALLRDLAEGSRPILAFSDASIGPLSIEQGNRHIVLTDLGLQILHGAVDLIDAHGIDRWWGGTHLTPTECWRWDHKTKRLQKSRSFPREK
ncbi:hypothetical protein JS562_23885 [Agrobacterium sp. S2]|nr:hypothetical protein [Agrobacterium sp. S2]